MRVMPFHNLPSQPTPFVGREEELAQITQLLAEPSCRLLSLLGPGGVGKTRLAIRAAEGQIHEFPDGVYFVTLAPIGSPELLASTIMDALGAFLSGTMDARAQLLNTLRGKHLLLVLDNFEHLLEGAMLVADMMENAPRLKVLVTSRERLNLREEWLLPLQGMRYPGDEEAAKANEEDYAAIQLFAQRARRVRSDFSLTTEGPHWVAFICQLVEGIPLAIELAAPWIQVMSCRDVAQEIVRDLGFLSTSLRDMPHRHRSMRAVFNHSWELLSPAKQGVLRQLSVFRGGFRRETAEAVAEATLPLLSTLVDKSWLRVMPSGRYEIHELIRQYSAERLREGSTEDGVLGAKPAKVGSGENELVRDRHSRYYGAFLQEREPRLVGHGQREAFGEILEEMDNVWSAWNWALEHEHVETIGQCASALEEVAELRGWHYEVNQAFDRAAAMLREQLDVNSLLKGMVPLGEAGLVLAEILHSQALECMKLGLRDQVRLMCEESLALLGHAAPGIRQIKATACSKGLLGTILRTLGDPSRGRQLLREALTLHEELDDSRGRVQALMILAAFPHHVGQYKEAESLLLEALAIADAAGDQRYKAWCLANLSDVLCTKGEYPRARRLAQEALQVRQELGDRAGTSDSLLRLAEIVLAVGDRVQARQHYQEALDIALETGDPDYKSRALNGLGKVASILEQHREARQLFEESLAVTREMDRKGLGPLVGLGFVTLALGEIEGSWQCFCEALEAALKEDRLLEAQDALVGLAHLLAEEEQLEWAVELLPLALHHPATAQVTRDRAQNLLAELELKLPVGMFAAASIRGKGRQLDDVVAEILYEEAHNR